MGLNRRQRDERIDADAGDPTDEVRIAGRSGRTYHIDLECYHLAFAAHTEVVTREKAQERGYCPCQRCVLGWERRDTPQLSPEIRLRRAGLLDGENA